MKTSNKTIMVNAWELARKGQAQFGGSVKQYFAVALKLSWAQFKMENGNDIDKLVAKLEKHVKTCQQRYATARKGIDEKARQDNDGIAPNYNRLGSPHAPFTGYEFEENLYVKGQFLPIPDVFDGDCFMNGPCAIKVEYDERVYISGALVESVVQAVVQGKKFTGITLQHGKVFTKRGKVSAIVYLKASSIGFLNVAKQFLVDTVKAQDEQDKLNAPAKGTAPEGRQEVTGTVLALPTFEDYYGFQFKMMVELENHSTVYGTIPGKILADLKIGDKVKFTAAFEHALKDGVTDTTHAFYKRPTKPGIIG